MCSVTPTAPPLLDRPTVDVDVEVGAEVDGAVAELVACDAIRRLAGLGAGEASARLLRVLDDAIGTLQDVALDATADDAEVRASVRELGRLGDRVHGEQLRRLAEAHERGAYRPARSTPDGVAADLVLGHAEARTLVETAAVLQRMPKTLAALLAGHVSAANTREAVRALLERERLERLARDRAAAEEQARRDADRDHDHDGDDDGDGDGLFDDQPPSDDPAAGDAGAGGRDAAEDVDDTAARAGRDTTRHGLRERLREQTAAEHADLLAEQARLQQANRSVWWGQGRHRDGLVTIDAGMTPEVAAMWEAAVDAEVAAIRVKNDPRTLRQLRHDALGSILRRTLDGGQLRRHGGVRPHVVLIKHLPAAGQPAQPSTLDGVGPLDPATEQQLLCDAETVEVVVRNNDVLDVGRTKRTATWRQRFAVIARDRRCIGCGRRAGGCQVHHVRFYEDGGPTDLDNLVLVCWSCHAQLHHGGWTVTRHADGHFTAGPAPTSQRRPR